METKTFRFAVFELNVAARELRKSGVRIRLQDQPLRILEMLLERRGEVVSREEIRDVLWPANISVDFDRSVNTAVNKLREALGDSAHTPRFIETIPRRGYRFIAPVESPSRVEQKAVPSRKPGVTPWLFPAACAVLIACLAWRWAGNSPRTTPIEPRPFTSYPGSEVQPSFSPDGSQVAFSWNGEHENNFDIYVKSIGAEHPLRLTTGPEPDLSPAWSPRGDMIAFLTSRIGSAGLYVVPATGGPARRLLDIHVPVVHYIPTQIAWHPDGESLIFPDRPSDQTPLALFRYSLRTGQRQKITAPPAESQGDMSPSLSPDGRSLLFARGPASAPRLYRLVLSEPTTPTEIKEEGVVPRNAVWAFDGREMVTVGGAQFRTGLWLLSSASQHAPRQIVRYPAAQPAVSQTRPRLAFTRADWDANIWQVSMRGGQNSARPLITSTYLDHLPALSPGGDRVAFVSTRSGEQGLYVSDRNGGSVQKLTTASLISMANWSPAGDRIVFSASYGQQDLEIYSISPDGSGLKRLTHAAAADVSPSWSENGEWIYFGSNRSGSFEIWRMHSSGGECQRVTDKGGFRALESKDGRFLYYAKGDYETVLWRAPVTGGNEELVAPSLSTSANFAVLRDGIVFIPAMDTAQRSTLEFLDFSTGKTRTLVRLEKRPVWGLAVDRDLVLFTQVDRESTDLMLMDSIALR